MAKFDETVSDPNLKNLGSAGKAGGGVNAVQAVKGITQVASAYVSERKGQAEQDFLEDLQEARTADFERDQRISQGIRQASLALPDTAEVPPEDIGDVLNQYNRIQSARSNIGQDLRVRAVTATAANRKFLSHDAIVRAGQRARGLSAESKALDLAKEKSPQEQWIERVIAEKPVGQSLQNYMRVTQDTSRAELFAQGLAEEGQEGYDSVQRYVPQIAHQSERQISDWLQANSGAPESEVLEMIAEQRLNLEQRARSYTERIRSSWPGKTGITLAAKLKEQTDAELAEFDSMTDTWRARGTAAYEENVARQEVLHFNGIFRSPAFRKLAKDSGIKNDEDIAAFNALGMRLQADSIADFNSKLNTQIKAVDPTKDPRMQETYDFMIVARNFVNLQHKLFGELLAVSLGGKDKLIDGDMKSLEQEIGKVMFGTEPLLQAKYLENIVKLGEGLEAGGVVGASEGYKSHALRLMMNSEVYQNIRKRLTADGLDIDPRMAANVMNAITGTGDLKDDHAKIIEDSVTKKAEQLSVLLEEGSYPELSLIQRDTGLQIGFTREDERAVTQTRLQDFPEGLRGPVTEGIGYVSHLLKKNYTEEPVIQTLASLEVAVSRLQEANREPPAAYLALMQNVTGQAIASTIEDTEEVTEALETEVQDQREAEVLYEDLERRPTREERLRARREEGDRATQNPGQRVSAERGANAPASEERKSRGQRIKERLEREARETNIPGQKERARREQEE
jgi:hypothetical protein